ncbi:leucyl aminopeptidase family protein [Rhizobium sp. CSW-27]|uniref:leucyl aminopeptidase family protein n=1 Tax=Rhizobium sp. CSW-27 TaxID=2839985 RepID=UPI001C02403D|nr:leucyl aminopeptidase family protein [Rhizobium sp. CSW-27]MBT9371440.1 leucyl aminopeptidase family protein [Rhizobium sp. CSW-27]
MAPYQFVERPSPFVSGNSEALIVHALTPAELEEGRPSAAAVAFARSAGFKAEAGSLLLLQGGDGVVSGALFGLGADPDPFITGKLARALPPGTWRIKAGALTPEQAALGFGLGGYSFDTYRTPKPIEAFLALPDGVDADALNRQLAAVFLARDLVNTPTNDMGPERLEAVFRALGSHYGATASSIVGDDLLTANFPLVHTVGRASAEAPRLLEMRWGRKGARKVTLVGKGVCFDTGGLDIKPPSSMLLMKKDMGGAANVLALALMIMDSGLDLDLRVLVPAVENSISANAFRPGDIYRSRKGLTVQIDNTDAEGRLVLADALAYADEETPDLMIDMATLTGAARVALGPDVPPFFTDDEDLALALAAASRAESDPVWRLPLFKGYEKDLRTRAADLTNAPSGGMAGSITAALFLKRFVANTRSWAHFDIYAWSPAEKPQTPVGGEAQAIRALYRHIATLA